MGKRKEFQDKLGVSDDSSTRTIQAMYEGLAGVYQTAGSEAMRQKLDEITEAYHYLLENRPRQANYVQRNSVVLAADVAGFCRLVSATEEGSLDFLHRCREAFRILVADHSGRIFNTAGDAILCEFARPADALRAAISIQAEIEVLNKGRAANRLMLFRMGIHQGEVFEQDGDLFGEVVNLAARLQTSAQPGEIVSSEAIAKAGADGVTLVPLGERTFKNIPRPVRTFAVIPGEMTVQEATKVLDTTRRTSFMFGDLEGTVAATRHVATPAAEATRTTTSKISSAEAGAPNPGAAPKKSPAPMPSRARAASAEPAESAPWPVLAIRWGIPFLGVVTLALFFLTKYSPSPVTSPDPATVSREPASEVPFAAPLAEALKPEPTTPIPAPAPAPASAPASTDAGAGQVFAQLDAAVAAKEANAPPSPPPATLPPAAAAEVAAAAVTIPDSPESPFKLPADPSAPACVQGWAPVPEERETGAELIHDKDNKLWTMLMPYPKPGTRIVDLNKFDFDDNYPTRFTFGNGQSIHAFISVDLSPGSRLQKCIDELSARVGTGEAAIRKLVTFGSDLMREEPTNFIYDWDPKVYFAIPPEQAQVKHLTPGHAPLHTDIKIPSVPLESYLRIRRGGFFTRTVLISLIMKRLKIPHRIRAGGDGSYGRYWIELKDTRILDSASEKLSIPGPAPGYPGWFRVGDGYLYQYQAFPVTAD